MTVIATARSEFAAWIAPALGPVIEWFQRCFPNGSERFLRRVRYAATTAFSQRLPGFAVDEQHVFVVF